MIDVSRDGCVRFLIDVCKNQITSNVISIYTMIARSTWFIHGFIRARASPWTPERRAEHGQEPHAQNVDAVANLSLRPSNE